MSEDRSFSWKGNDGARIRVGVEPSYVFRNVCRFAVDPPVYPDGALHLSLHRDFRLSPLARRIFALGDVAEVLVAGDSVTVTTAQPAEWEDLGERIASVIREQIDSGIPSVDPEHAKGLPPAAVIREKVQELIDSTVAPAVASHGGEVTLIDVERNNVVLRFGGGCQGCGMAHVTLKYGVERLIRERIPEVGLVLDTTDHADGRDPFYAPGDR